MIHTARQGMKERQAEEKAGIRKTNLNGYKRKNRKTFTKGPQC